MSASSSPWVLHTVPHNGVDQHLFTIDQSKVATCGDKEYEYYAWASSDFNSPVLQVNGKKQKTLKLPGSGLPDKGILFPISRWTKLRGVDKNNLQTWTSLPYYNVSDGRDIYGKLTPVKFRPDGYGKAPKAQDFEDWYRRGQQEYKNSAYETVESYTGWTPATFYCPEKVTNTNQVTQGTGRGFKMKISPDEADYPMSDRYIKLRNKDYKALGPGGKDVPLAAYISETAYNKLIGGTYPWQNENKHRLGIRTELGNLQWIDCSTAVNLELKSNWEKWRNNATKTIDRDSAWSRRIDPVLTLYIVPTGNTRLTNTELWYIFDQTKERIIDGKQSYVRADGLTEEELKDYKLLGVSPFFDYCTLIKKEDWISYLIARPDRQSPNSLADVQAAISQVKPDITEPYDQSGTRDIFMQNTVTANKIRAAVGTRPDAPQQSDVMGGSATKIATSFKWIDANKRIGKSADGKWPGTSNMPAEWLHRSAYSWGGLAEEGYPFSSQVPENLIFGSSECNSVMTRYEKSYQALFLKEDAFRKKYEPQTRDSFKGTLCSMTLGFNVLGSTQDSPFDEVLRKFSKGDLSDDLQKWPNWCRIAPWLCFTLGYGLHINQPSRILGPGDTWTTVFYPFQRGFYTVLESEVDLRLLEFLTEKRVNEEGLKEAMEEETNLVVTQQSVPHLAAIAIHDITLGTGEDTSPVKSFFAAPAVAQDSSLKSDISMVSTPVAIEVVDGSVELESLGSQSPIDGTSVPRDAESKSPTEDIQRENDKPPTSDVYADLTDDDTLWAAVTSGQKQVVVDGVLISNPRLMSMDKDRNQSEIPATKLGLDSNGGGIPLDEHQVTPSPTTPTIPPEFIIKGDITVFGLALPITFASVKGRNSPGMIERISLPPVLTLGTLIPEFSGSPLDVITLTNTYLIYYSFSRGPSKPPGLHMHTEVALTGILQPVSDVLQTVFNMPHPALTVAGFVSARRDWKSPLVPVGFTLSAALLKMQVSLFGVVEITDIGIDLIAGRKLKDNGRGLGYDLSHAYWGSAGVAVPGSVVPMRVEWRLSIMPSGGYSMMLAMQDESWTDVMGVQGLNVENVEFCAWWNAGDALNTVDLGIRATLALRSGTLVLRGEYSKASWILAASLKDVDLTMIEEMYEDIFGTMLNGIDAAHDVTFKSIQLSISNAGLVLNGEVTVNGYTSASATVSLTTAGVEIKGSIQTIELEGVTVDNATLDVFIGTASSVTGRPFRVQISGTVTWRNFKIPVGLYINKVSGTDAQWTVYGELDGDLKLSHLAPEISGTWLDIGITQAAFVASNEDDLSEQVPNKYRYPVKKGVQVCATVVETINAINGITKTKAGGLTLCAAFSGEELSVDVNMPTDKGIILNKNIASGPMSFEIVVSDNPHVKVEAELDVTVGNQSEQLKLKLYLEAGEELAKGRGTMDGPWENPLGLSEQLKIESLLLDIEIIYEEFIETGVPEKIEFGGRAVIGPAPVEVIIELSEVPTEELIYAKVTNLDLSAMFKLGNKSSQVTTGPPEAHNETLKFRELLLYFSTGATFKGITYPPGISFKSNMELFGCISQVNAVIAEQITINGTMDPFDIGPLTVKGFQDPQATVDVAIGPADNHIHIDGAVTLYELSAAVHVNIDLSPKPQIDFQTTLKFGQYLSFSLEAQMDGELSGTDTKNLDFLLSAEMHQEIIKYIIDEAQTHFMAAHEAAKAGFAATDADLSSKEAQFSAALDIAKKDLDIKKAEWDAKREAVNRSFNDKKAELDKEKANKEKDLEDAQNKLDNAIRIVEQELEQLKSDVAQKVQEAEVAVERAAREAEAKLEVWKKDVAKEQAALDSVYGNVENCMKAARSDLINAENAMNAKSAEIDSLNRQIDNAGFWDRIRLHWDVCELEIEKGVLDAAFWVAKKTVDAGDALLKEAYNDAQKVLQGAQKILSDGEAAIATEGQQLQGALESAKQDAESAIITAMAKVESVKNSGDIKALFDTAKKALDDFIAGLQGALGDVQEAVDTIEKCAEYIAYTAALGGLDFAQKNIKTLDPARLALKLVQGAEEAVSCVVEEAIKVAGNILDVQSVILKGSLKGLVEQTKPLEGTVVAVLAGKTETFRVYYVPGGVEKFLEELWDSVYKKLKRLL